MNRTDILRIALKSCAWFFCLGFRSLKLKKHRLNQVFEIKDASHYRLFRETISQKDLEEKPQILIIGFRLKLIGSNSFFHWLFQRVCILTTPFWSGLRGFKIKLWMVNPDNKNYLGIYEWLGEDNALRYIDFLIPILSFFSKRGSIWHRRVSNQKLEGFLN